MWRKWWTPNNASKQQMGFNSAFKGLICAVELWNSVYCNHKANFSITQDEHSYQIFSTVPQIRHVSQTNFVPIFFLFFQFYSIFLVTFFRMDNFLDLVSGFPSEEMATVLCLEKYRVKMHVKYVNHGCKVCNILQPFKCCPCPQKRQGKIVTFT